MIASVFAGEHHDHYPLRDSGIAGARRVIDEVTVVVIDLEQYLDIIYGHDRAVVLAIRVIVIGKCVKGRPCSEDTRNGSVAQCLNARLIIIRPPRRKRRSSSFSARTRAEL